MAPGIDGLPRLMCRHFAHPPRRADPVSAERRERLRRDRELFARYHDPSSPVDRDMVVARFLPLARRLAAGYAHTNESFDDLFQVACLGLVNAVDRFDSRREIAFSSYAVPTILGEIKRYYRDKTWSVRVPRELQEFALGIERESEHLTARRGRPPTIDEVADAVGAPREAVLEARGALGAYHADSLEDSRSGATTTTTRCCPSSAARRPATRASSSVSCWTACSAA